MTGLRLAIVLCVFLIQRAACQTCNCQSDLYISIEDLINALNNGPGIPELINQSQGCGCQQSQQSGGNQQSCGCQQSQQSGGYQQSCGCNQPSQPQPSITINSLPSNQCGFNRPISIGQPCGCNQQISLGQSCGCNQPSNQPSLSISSLPLSFSNQQSCNQPISVTSPPVTLNLQSNNQPSISLSNQQSSCNQPSISISNQQCGNQPSNQPSLSISSLPLSFSNQQSCNQPISVTSPPVTLNLQSNQPSIPLNNQQSSCNQPSISISNQQCGNQPSQSRQSISFQPISLGNQVSNSVSQGCQSQSSNQIAISDYESVTIVPAALLQAPPYGIFFAGDNLLIDGAVQVCGNLPFNSVIELGGVVPTTGSGCVQYVCGELCS